MSEIVTTFFKQTMGGLGALVIGNCLFIVFDSSCCRKLKGLTAVILNLIQNLYKSYCYETLKLVQGDNMEFPQQILMSNEV
jgi:hypothetical protein